MVVEERKKEIEINEFPPRHYVFSNSSVVSSSPIISSAS